MKWKLIFVVRLALRIFIIVIITLRNNFIRDRTMFSFGESWPFSLVPALFIAVPISVLILVYSYIKIRPKFPARVECWFCHKKSDVPYDNRNCWDCPHCEQYNGFSADGGYNKVIPAQHDELLNHAVTAKSSLNKKSPMAPSKSPFCRKCTINQDLKIQQLASFTPRDPAHFDEEVEEYRQHLERAYQLCDSCELILKKTLRQQQGFLLDQHRQHQSINRSQPAHRVIAWWQRGLPLIWMQRTQIASSVVALGLLISQNHGFLVRSFSQYISPDVAYILEILPKYDHIVASLSTIAVIIITGCSTYRRRIDIITAVLWFALLVHKWLLFWPYLRTHVNDDDLKMGHVIVIALTFLVNTIAAVTSRQVCPSKPLMMKRLKQGVDGVCRGRDITERFKSPVAVDHALDKSSSLCSSDTFLTHAPASSAAVRADPEQYTSIQSTAAEGLTPICSTYSPSEELEWVLGKLSLGPSNIRNRSSTIFKTKSFSTTNGEGVFQNAYQSADVGNGNHSHLLRPSKLNFRRNVTQTSWVAGGYWRELGGTLSKAVQSGRNLLETSFQSPSSSPISRTSSQSSGFHSRSSNSPASSPNSYSGSLCGGDVDRFSVLSDVAAPTCHCNSSMNNTPPVSKLPFIGMQYYGGFPVCVPHVCPLSVATSPGVFGPRNVLWMTNPQYFQTPKQCFSSACYFPPFPQPPTKQLPQSHAGASDALSYSGSSVHSSDHIVVPEHEKKNMQNIWQIMKQNVFLSVLCIGSVLFNVIGMGMLVYQNRFVFKLEQYFS